MTPNWSKTFQKFWSHSSVLSLEKQPANLNFQSFFISDRPFGDYFQWNECAYFQKICNLARHCDAKLIKNISKFLVALLRFGFRKEPKSLNFHIFLGSNRPFVGYIQWMAYTYFQKICIWTRYIDPKLIKNILNLLVILLRFWFRKQLRTLNFQSFLPLKDTLLGTFNERRTSTSRKHASEQGIVMSNCSKTFQNFRSHSFVFLFRKTTYKSKFSKTFYL